MKNFLPLLCILCAVCLAGCEKGAPRSSGATRMTVNGVEYSIEGASSQDVSVVNNVLTYRGGGLTVFESAGRLVVNGKAYGPVQSGDKVSVSKVGKVFVNGTARAPR